jgi:site-specific recombinase XerD
VSEGSVGDFSARVTAFLEFKRHNKNRSLRTIEAYRLALGRMEEFYAGRDPLEGTRDDLVLFTGIWLHRKGLGPAARRTYVMGVREFYKWLVANRHVKTNVAANIEYPRIPRALPEAMSLASAEKLMFAPDYNTFIGVRDSAMFALLLGCGLRVSGLVGLNESDVLHESIDGRPRLVIRVREKGDRVRKVPVPQDADLMLRVYIDHAELKAIDRQLDDGDRVLFVSTKCPSCPAHEYRGARRRLNRRALARIFAHYGKDLDIPKEHLHPHAMRHLFGAELAESDVDLLVRQMLMGHSDPTSTKIYTDLAIRKLAREADRANPLAKIKTPVSDILKRLQQP